MSQVANMRHSKAPVKRARIFEYNRQHLSDIRLHIVARCWVFGWSNALNILPRHLFQTGRELQEQKKCIVTQHLSMQHFLSRSNFLRQHTTCCDMSRHV